MLIIAAIVAILLLLAFVAWLVRRAGRNSRSRGRAGGAYSSTDSYIHGGTTADSFGASESSSDTGFGGGGDFGGGGSGGDFGGGGDGGGGNGGGGNGGGE